MRKRAKRDLITLTGIIILLLGVVGANMYMRLDSLKEAAEKLRKQYESKHRAAGHTLIDWENMRATKGNLKSGPRFSKEIEELDDALVNIVGFMSPIDQFSNVTEFMLMPLPSSCFFCDSPPMRDIIHIQLEKPSKMVEEPVLIGGEFHLHKEPGAMFFTSIVGAKWNEAVDMRRLTTNKDHQGHLIAGWNKRRKGNVEEPLSAPMQIRSLTPDEALGNTPDQTFSSMGIKTDGVTHEGMPKIAEPELVEGRKLPSAANSID